MKRFYSRTIKGLLIALLIIIVGGCVFLKVGMPSLKEMVLLSSSVVNANNAKSENKKEEVVEEPKEEIKEEVQEEKKEEVVVEEKKEVKKTEKKEEVVTPKVEEKKEEVVVETPKVEEKKEEPKQEEVKPSVPTPNGSYEPNTGAVGGALETYYGPITAYGPDCYGCVSGETASGYNVSNGNIYYHDATYGTIRIVAGDKSLPFGTIVKITGLNISSEPILAIVLDRGGAIGFNKSIYFDLLFTSERSSEVNNFGKQYATIEILRRGY